MFEYILLLVRFILVASIATFGFVLTIIGVIGGIVSALLGRKLWKLLAISTICFTALIIALIFVTALVSENISIIF